MSGLILSESDILLLAKAQAQLLFIIRNANFQSTSDQKFQKVFGGTNYHIPATGHIFARQRSGAASVACAGGIYDTAAKSGNIIVLAAQSWVTLAAAVPVVPTLNTAVTYVNILTNTPFFSLTTGSTAACTGDVFIWGYDVT